MEIIVFLMRVTIVLCILKCLKHHRFNADYRGHLALGVAMAFTFGCLIDLDRFALLEIDVFGRWQHYPNNALIYCLPVMLGALRTVWDLKDRGDKRERSTSNRDAVLNRTPTRSRDSRDIWDVGDNQRASG